MTAPKTCGLMSANWTVRDGFAAAVLPSIYEDYCIGARNQEYVLTEDWQTGVALDAYKIADAMLEAREAK